MEVVVLPCPDCGQKILISNPIQGKPVSCGCGTQLKLVHVGTNPGGNPGGEFWTGFAWGGFLMAVASMVGLPYLVGMYIAKRVAR